MQSFLPLGSIWKWSRAIYTLNMEAESPYFLEYRFSRQSNEHKETRSFLYQKIITRCLKAVPAAWSCSRERPMGWRSWRACAHDARARRQTKRGSLIRQTQRIAGQLDPLVLKAADKASLASDVSLSSNCIMQWGLCGLGSDLERHKLVWYVVSLLLGGIGLNLNLEVFVFCFFF